jgi:hypothetical protein
VKYVRKWYTPWKKVKVSGGQFKVSWEIVMRKWPCTGLGGDHDRKSVEQWLDAREIMQLTPRHLLNGSTPTDSKVSQAPTSKSEGRKQAGMSSKGERKVRSSTSRQTANRHQSAIHPSSSSYSFHRAWADKNLFPSLTRSPTENQFLKFISYFRGPILYVMEIAVVLAAGLRDWIDFGVIIGIVGGTNHLNKLK